MRNSDRLERDLAFLTGPAAAGRLSGTSGALRTARYLRAELEMMGFQAALQPVSVPAARLSGPSHLVIAGQSFSARRDFAEMTALSSAGHLTGRLLVVRDGDQLLLDTFRERVVLIPERPQGFELADTARNAAELGIAALLVEHGEPDWFHKTIYTGRGQIPVLRVRKSVANHLVSMDGAPVELELPLHRESISCNDVLGWLPATSSDFTLALTAHYDHVGDDPGGASFPGAFDNASGAAAILAAAGELSRERLPFNLLVAFLTGEESGLWGARQLIAYAPSPISAALNLDGVGSESRLNAVRLGHVRRGDWMAELAEQVLLGRGISAQWINGSDDSSAFISDGIPAAGLGQQPTGQAPSTMHTPLDTMERLHLGTIREGIDVLVEIVGAISEIQTKKENHHVYAR